MSRNASRNSLFGLGFGLIASASILAVVSYRAANAGVATKRISMTPRWDVPRPESDYVRRGIGRLEGTVLDPSGNPVPDAELLLVDARIADPATEGGIPGLPLGSTTHPTRSVKTDEGGRFLVSAIRAGPWVVMARASGFLRQRSSAYVAIEGERSAAATMRLDPASEPGVVLLPVLAPCWLHRHALRVHATYAGWWPEDQRRPSWCYLPTPGIAACGVRKTSPDGWPSRVEVRCPVDGAFEVSVESAFTASARPLSQPTAPIVVARMSPTKAPTGEAASNSSGATKGQSTLFVQVPMPFLKVELDSLRFDGTRTAYTDEHGVAEFYGLSDGRYLAKCLFPGGRASLPVGIDLNAGVATSAEIRVGDGLYQDYAERVTVACFLVNEQDQPIVGAHCILNANTASGWRYTQRAEANEFGYCRFVDVPSDVDAECIVWLPTEGISVMAVRGFNTCFGSQDSTTVLVLPVPSNRLTFSIPEEVTAPEGGSLLVNLMSFGEHGPVVVYSSWWRPSGPLLELATVPSGMYWCELRSRGEIVFYTEPQTSR